MHTPVAFIIFNRPDLTERVFAEIARARPEKLLVIADGPRPGCEGEEAKCAATRAIVERIDWPCEVLKNYSNVNLGCGHRPATGLRWVFELVEEAIILEDDCVPHPTFFRFCEELLDRYRDDERVMHISGDNFTSSEKRNAFDYSFSYYTLSWGWATWRRAFQHYDPDIILWAILRKTPWLWEILVHKEAVDYWTRIFDKAHLDGDRAGYWDYQWLFACWAQRGLSILPGVNLISNIGYGAHATHTKSSGDPRGDLPTGEMMFPLKHPPCVIRQRDDDDIIFNRVVRPQGRRSLYQRLREQFAASFPPPLRELIRSLKSSLVSSKLFPRMNSQK
jgi:hypothetical protein